MTISAIIPVWNERDSLPETIAQAQRVLPGCEIVGVDGGSTDGTREWLGEQTAVRWVSSVRGRGPQMNAGAGAAQGEAFLFLHADCRLPNGAERAICAALADKTVAGGAFRVHFPKSCPPTLHTTAWLINGRSRLFREATGDQAIFVRADVFRAAGGFPNWPLFEDFELVSRLKRQGRFQILREAVTISPRRWQTFGIGRTNALMCLLYGGYKLGIAPQTLKRWFADVRPAAKPLSPEHESPGLDRP